MDIQASVDLTDAVSRAVALFDTGDLDAAEVLFRDALTLDSEDLSAATGLAKTLDRMRRFDDAFDVWETALRIAPDDVICQYALGDAWQRRAP